MIQKYILSVCFWLSIFLQEIILSVFGFFNIKIFYEF